MNTLKAKMEEKKISGLELSRITGIAPCVISNLKNGKQWPYPAWRKKISEALDVPEEKLFPKLKGGASSAG